MLALFIVTSGVASAGAAASEPAEASDPSIVSERRELTPNEIREFDVTDTAGGKGSLEGALERSGRGEIPNALYRVYEFGDYRLVTAAATTLRVWEGKSADGRLVHETASLAVPPAVPDQQGYAVPPSSAFRYNHDAWQEETVGTWYRQQWWTMNKANDWKACSTCPVHDYWRMYAKLQAGALQGSASDEGFRKAWIELDRADGWSTIYGFEEGQPSETVAGGGTQTLSIGFGTTWTLSLGVPPLTASGSGTNTYGGSITVSNENWHPIMRGEAGSWGVQWCRYNTPEFTGTKYITTRASARISSTGTNAGWWVQRGQRESTASCPGQV